MAPGEEISGCRTRLLKTKGSEGIRMEARANHVLIGVATILLIVGMVIFGLWMAKFGEDGETIAYDVIFREAVNGLAEGSRVEYNGIRVGSVSDLRIDLINPNQIIARINISSDTPVTSDTQARLAMTNITGASHIQLSTDSFDGPPLVARGDAKVPVIIAEPSPIAQLRTHWEDSIGGLNLLVDNANQMLSAKNTESITAILLNLESASNFFVTQQHEFAEAIQGISSTGESADKAFASLDALINDVGVVFGNHGDALLSDTGALIERLNKVAASFEHLLDDNKGALDQGFRNLEGIGPIMRDFRHAVNTLERTMRKFDEDPAGYLLGRERLPEFEP